MSLKYCIINDYTPKYWNKLYTTIMCSKIRTGSHDIGYYGIGVYFYNNCKLQIEVI